MQTASSQKPIPASGGNPLPPAAAASFVINLSSSTTPVALTRPDHAGLKRFTFFVSRRREEGRERFRLHMGYFPSQEEAEKLLDIVREFYPGAWAGSAPGQRLRTAVAHATTPAPASPTSASTPSPATPIASPAAASKPAPVPVPVPVPAPAPASTSGPTSASAPASVPVPPAASAPVAATVALSLIPDAGRQLAAADSQAGPEGDAAAALALTNVRAAIASLDDPATPPMDVPELKPAVIAKVPRAVAPADVPVAHPVRVVGKATSAGPAKAPKPATAAVLNDAQALQVLERGASTEGASTEGKAEPACFAVQLMWSVQPIEMAKVPQLAIFSAYTLYAAEGNRNGRRWYGLRLGFFTDAVSAKQVAHYVRSEFSTVSIVPVTVRERERARTAAPVRSAATATPIKSESNEFAFIDDKPAPTSATPPTLGAPTRGGRSGGAPGKRAKLRSAAPKALPLQRKARKELSLEETLEILGADQLQMEIEGSGHSPASVSESGVRHLQLQQVKGKGSRLGRLINRLSGMDKA